MSQKSEKDLVEEFKSVTGASDTTAKSYLNSTKFDLQSAITKFLDHQTDSKKEKKVDKRQPGTVNTFKDNGDGSSGDESDGTKRDYIGSGLNVIGSKKEDDIYNQIIKKAQKQGGQPKDNEEKQKKRITKR